MVYIIMLTELLFNCKQCQAFVSYENMKPYGAFTLDVKSVLNENLGGILGGTQC